MTAGANPIAVKKGIDKTMEHLVAKLKENAKPIKGRQDIKVRPPVPLPLSRLLLPLFQLCTHAHT